MAASGDGRKNGRRGKPAAGAAVKRTILLSPETDMKLDVLARHRGLTRSALAELVLAEACRGVVVSIRGRERDRDRGANPEVPGEAVA
jgi:hypothetical protein